MCLIFILFIFYSFTGFVFEYFIYLFYTYSFYFALFMFVRILFMLLLFYYYYFDKMYCKLPDYLIMLNHNIRKQNIIFSLYICVADMHRIRWPFQSIFLADFRQLINTLMQNPQLTTCVCNKKSQKTILWKQCGNNTKPSQGRQNICTGVGPASIGIVRKNHFIRERLSSGI